MPNDKGFDGDAYYRALETVVETRSKNWKDVANETGVSASTLTRMAQGKRPDAASLAALSAWADLNPSDFVRAAYVKDSGDAIGRISTLLRTDPNLDAEAADTIDRIVRAAYQQMRKEEG
jgi:transcriptional regulator with XRE-family HTH domain